MKIEFGGSWLCDQMEAAFHLTGMTAFAGQLYPLRTEDELVALLSGMHHFPPGVPERARRVHERLPAGSALCSSDIGVLIGRLDTEGGLGGLYKHLAHTKEGPLHLVPSITHCAVCALNGEQVPLVVKSSLGNAFPRPTVYLDGRGGVRESVLYCKWCPRCNAKHNMSYAEGGTILQRGEQLAYPGAMQRDNRFVQLSRDTIIETEVLVRLTSQMVHSHTGYETFATEYTELANLSPALADALQKNLVHAWLAWTLLLWREELDVTNQPLRFASGDDLDATLLHHTMRRVESDRPNLGRFHPDSLIARFTNKWGRQHARVCLAPKDGYSTCMCYILDGHMKCRRLICENRCPSLLTLCRSAAMCRRRGRTRLAVL